MREIGVKKAQRNDSVAVSAIKKNVTNFPHSNKINTKGALSTATTTAGHHFCNMSVYAPGQILQAQLSVNTPGDRYELEANSMADKVVSKPGAGNVRQKPLSENITSVKQAEGTGITADPILSNKITSAQGRGSSMDSNTQSLMSKNFNTDFGKVKIHTDSEAEKMNDSLTANAFTVGSDIFFNKGKYNPGTSEGKHLLAHELTHVVQQKAGKQIQRDINETVVKSDTVFSLSQLFGVSAASIATANKLKGNQISIGQTLIIPGVNMVSHTVKSGETLFSLSQQFKVNQGAITRVNSLQGTTINAGQVLNIPVVGQAGSTVIPPVKPSQPSQTTQVPKVTVPPTPTTSATTPTTKPTIPATTTPATTSAATPATGHAVNADYGSGSVLQRSDLLQSDLKTHLKSGGSNVFFQPGTNVKLISTKGLWVEVSGPVFTNAAKPAAVMAAGKPTQMTGWIHREMTDMTLGKFDNLAIKDESHFKNAAGLIGHVGRDSPLTKPKGLVLHQTGSTNASSTISNTYAGRVKANKSVGSHYVIGQGGDINLTGGLDRIVDNVGPNNKSGGSLNPAVTNSFSVGIEHSGAPTTLSSPHNLTPKDKGFAAQMQVVRTEISKLNLSPDLKQKLVGLTDKKLYYELTWANTAKPQNWDLYEDITPEQKRSSFQLVRDLRQKFKLGISDVYAHEDLSAKSIGEGENILEFHQKMELYPQKVSTLAAVGTSQATLSAIILNEKNILSAIQVDATAAENAALAKKDPAALAREKIRVSFYKDFYLRLTQLDNMISFLQASGQTVNQTKLAAMIAAWKF